MGVNTTLLSFRKLRVKILNLKDLGGRPLPLAPCFLRLCFQWLLLVCVQGVIALLPPPPPTWKSPANDQPVTLTKKTNFSYLLNHEIITIGLYYTVQFYPMIMSILLYLYRLLRTSYHCFPILNRLYKKGHSGIPFQYSRSYPVS